MSIDSINNNCRIYRDRYYTENKVKQTEQSAASIFAVQNNENNFRVSNPLEEDIFTYQNENQTTADSLKEELNEIKEEQGVIGNLWDGFKNLTGLGAGSNKTEKIIEQFENGEITEEEAKSAVEKYKAGQEMAVDVVADMASGIISVGAFALAAPTGGASLALGLGAAAAVGAGVKTGVKVTDAVIGGRDYGAKDLVHDTLTGAVNGLFAPVTNGIGASVTKTIGKKLGLTVVKEGTEAIVEQGAKTTLTSIITQKGVDVIGGTLGKRALATGAGMAVDGALGGAADNMIRAALDGEDVLKAGAEGAIGGLIMAPVIGGGFKLAGKAGRSLNNKITTKNLFEDGMNTTFKQGATGDCALLSTIDGLMNSDEAREKISKSITKSLGGDYEVIIGNRSITVAKDALTDEMLSDTSGIRIFEAAYKQIAGDIDEGFADVIAKEFGLNPVHITSDLIDDSMLDSLSKEQGAILSFGKEITGTDGTTSNHYFTIKDIDPASKKVIVSDTYDTGKLIELSYDDIKKQAISIDGGTIGETSIQSSIRSADDIAFKGKVNLDETRQSFIKAIGGDSNPEEVKKLNGLLSDMIGLDGSEISIDDLAAAIKMNGLTEDDISKVFKECFAGESISDVIDALGENGAAECLMEFNNVLNKYSIIQNNTLFEPYKLSLSEVKSILDANGNPQTVMEILQKNNSELFSALGGESYFYSKTGELNNMLTQMPELGKAISANNLIDTGVEVNGKRKYFIFPGGTTIQSSGREIDMETLIKSNMVTSDFIELAQKNGINLGETASKSLGKGKKYTFNIAEIIGKAQTEGYDSLTSFETHTLTDTLKDLYKNGSFDKAISSDSSLKTKARKLASCVDFLKSKAQSVIKQSGLNVEIGDHAYLRMIDRNLASTVDLSTGQVVDYEGLIRLISKAASEGKTIIDGYECASGIKMILKQDGSKTIIDSIM